MPNHDFEYVNMKRVLDNVRQAINEETQPNPHVIGNKDAELQNQALGSDKEDKKISLDNNKQATVITDNGDVDGSIMMGLQTILNGFMEAIQGTITSIDLLTVHIGDASMVITAKLIMDDSQPIIINVNSENQTVQAKYENFFELTEKNLMLLTRVKRYFNPKLMSQLQGAVSAKTENI